MSEETLNYPAYNLNLKEEQRPAGAAGTGIDLKPIMESVAADLTEMVYQYYNSYETKDRNMLESVLSENFIFSSPEDNYINRHAYFEKWWPQADSIVAINVEKVIVHLDEVVTQFVIGVKDGRQFRNAEIMKFENGQIAKIDTYFGRELTPANLKKAPGMGMGM